MTKVVKGDENFTTNTQAACNALKANQNEASCAAMLRLKSMLRGMKSMVEASRKSYMNAFQEDSHTIRDSKNWEIFEKGLQNIADMESTSDLQLLFSLLDVRC